MPKKIQVPLRGQERQIASAAWTALIPVLNRSRIARVLGISTGVIHEWSYVPDRYAPAVAEMTRIPIECLRPDIKTPAVALGDIKPQRFFISYDEERRQMAVTDRHGVAPVQFCASLTDAFTLCAADEAGYRLAATVAAE